VKFAADFLDYAINSRGYSRATVAAYESAIADLEKTLGIDDPAKLTVSDLDLYMTRKALAGTAASTRRVRGNALKSFFRYLHSRGKIPTDPGAMLKPPAAVRGVVPSFSEAEVEALIFHELEPTVKRAQGEALEFFRIRAEVERLCQLRDSALLGLSYAVGLRSGEVAGLTLDSISYDSKGACFVSLMGKAAKEPKRFFVDRRIGALLDAYLLARREAGISSPALFCPVGKLRGDVARGINSDRVAGILRKRIKDARISTKGRRITPHIWRYTRATHLYEAGLPLLEIRDFLRHANIETTLSYIRLGSLQSIQKKAAAKLPWNRPRGPATSLPT